TATPHGGHREDLVAARVESGGFEVQCDPLVSGIGLEQAGVRARACAAKLEPATGESWQDHACRRSMRRGQARRPDALVVVPAIAGTTGICLLGAKAARLKHRTQPRQHLVPKPAIT